MGSSAPLPSVALLHLVKKSSIFQTWSQEVVGCIKQGCRGKAHKATWEASQVG